MVLSKAREGLSQESATSLLYKNELRLLSSATHSNVKL